MSVAPVRRLRHRKYLLEAGLWAFGLPALACMNPEGEHLFSLCPFRWLWAQGCPGCGLGHAIAYLFRGAWRASWQAHPLALPAVGLLLWRCTQLLCWHRKHFGTSKTKDNG